MALGLLSLFVGLSCTTMVGRDASVIDTWSNDPKILNGIAYDRGLVPEGTWDRVIVPEGTKVVRAEGDHCWRCVMRKQVDNAATPPDLQSVYEIRNNMGCAVRREGRATLRVGTFGDHSGENSHGTRKTSLTLYLPQSLKVEYADKQTGLECKGVLAPGVPMNAVPQEWTAIIDSPDPQEAAYHRAEDEAKGKKE